jgi:hypothetical protein
MNIAKCWDRIELFEDNSRYYHYYDNKLFPNYDNQLFSNTREVGSIRAIDMLDCYDLDNIICQECYTIMDIIK